MAEFSDILGSLLYGGVERNPNYNPTDPGTVGNDVPLDDQGNPLNKNGSVMSDDDIAANVQAASTPYRQPGRFETALAPATAAYETAQNNQGFNIANTANYENDANNAVGASNVGIVRDAGLLPRSMTGINPTAIHLATPNLFPSTTGATATSIGENKDGVPETNITTGVNIADLAKSQSTFNLHRNGTLQQISTLGDDLLLKKAKDLDPVTLDSAIKEAGGDLSRAENLNKFRAIVLGNQITQAKTETPTLEQNYADRDMLATAAGNRNVTGLYESVYGGSPQAIQSEPFITVTGKHNVLMKVRNPNYVNPMMAKIAGLGAESQISPGTGIINKKTGQPFNSSVSVDSMMGSNPYVPDETPESNSIADKPRPAAPLESVGAIPSIYNAEKAGITTPGGGSLSLLARPIAQKLSDWKTGIIGGVYEPQANQPSTILDTALYKKKIGKPLTSEEQAIYNKYAATRVMGRKPYSSLSYLNQ
jgi:hypothetical protein